MKKGFLKTLVFGLFFVTAFGLSLAPMGSAAQAANYSIGMTVQDLSNQVWSATCEELKKLVQADGGTFTCLDSKSNPSTQIGHVENFISGNVDAIIIQVAERNALEGSLAQARSQGIKVFSWDDNLENSDINWLIDNRLLGQIIGHEAAKWINEKHGGVAEVGVLDYPQLEILLERGQGIVETIEKEAPGAKIVAQSSAINPTEGMAKTETFLQAHPNMKVIACIGGGGAVGANEAVKSSGKLTDDFGIFAADATPEELTAMANNEAIRMSVLNTGDAKAKADEIFGLVKKLLNNEPVERIVYRSNIPVSAENLDQYFTK
ncbi:MAG: sugar ABC transporter substrate-binding protein [Deltaproteobacteria bacterium]|jgi:ribose transport system substrate-binding protein|nr:sugar ABC transporter substrate-binding protein [Deltaproteobacteria bacterium]